MDHMGISGNEPSSVILSQINWIRKLENDCPKVQKLCNTIILHGQKAGSRIFKKTLKLDLLCTILYIKKGTGKKLYTIVFSSTG